MSPQRIQCWLTDLASDLRLEELLDKTMESVIHACPGHEFALLIMVEDELSVVRTSGLGPGARRRLEKWARECAKALVEPIEIDDLRGDPELMGLAARLSQGALHARPLLFKARSLGVLIALAPEGEHFDDDDRELLAAFTEQAAVALANAQLFQTLLENATHDALTDLPNRREFERQLRRELERCNRYGEIFSLAVIDFDHFKRLNDSRGHQAGDKLLRQAADTIQEACRASDAAGRLGGDEFALLLPETNQFAAAALCERLRLEVETLADVSLSWGIAEYPAHGVTTNALMRAADAAMYASKPRMVGGERALTPG
ncbi:MAG TPA: sensor domain-containing diguanylate cyclase [Thermoleophilaceae bacterium]|nr:sensor domain-containing diguanylate cyclase [Thermoleophilaceae bacterium]